MRASYPQKINNFLIKNKIEQKLVNNTAEESNRILHNLKHLQVLLKDKNRVNIIKKYSFPHQHKNICIHVIKQLKVFFTVD
jgi:hypothetical protein